MRDGQNAVRMHGFTRLSAFNLYILLSVLANIDATMVKPTPERPFEGILSIHSELSPMASSEYEIGR